MPEKKPKSSSSSSKKTVSPQEKTDSQAKLLRSEQSQTKQFSKKLSQKNQKKNTLLILERLKAKYPNPRCFLTFENPLQLLIATILSAQCTDIRVNQVTPILFEHFKTAEDYASASQEELESIIHSTGFFRSKAKNIRAACQILAEKYHSVVPCDFDVLVSLPGVGRKTANVVMGNAFEIASGFVVDTHVARLAQRMGLTSETTPEKIELDLMRLIPQNEWIDLSHRLIFLGRELCSAKKTFCFNCPLQDCCAFGLQKIKENENK